MSINVAAIRTVIQNALAKAKADYDEAKLVLADAHAREAAELQSKHAAEAAELDGQHVAGLAWADQVLAIDEPAADAATAAE